MACCSLVCLSFFTDTSWSSQSSHARTRPQDPQIPIPSTGFRGMFPASLEEKTEAGACCGRYSRRTACPIRTSLTPRDEQRNTFGDILERVGRREPLLQGMERIAVIRPARTRRYSQNVQVFPRQGISRDIICETAIDSVRGYRDWMSAQKIVFPDPRCSQPE